MEYGSKPAERSAQNETPGYYNRGWNDPPPSLQGGGSAVAGAASRRKDKRRHHAAAATGGMPPLLTTESGVAASTVGLPPPLDTAASGLKSAGAAAADSATTSLTGLSLKASDKPPTGSPATERKDGTEQKAHASQAAQAAPEASPAQVRQQLSSLLDACSQHPDVAQKTLEDVRKRLKPLEQALDNASIDKAALALVAAIVKALEEHNADAAAATHVQLVRDHGVSAGGWAVALKKLIHVARVLA